MPAERYFTEQTFTVHDIVNLVDDDCRHLQKVMRTQVGDSVELVNGCGQLAQATVTSLAKLHASLEINVVESAEKPSFDLILAQGIPKQNRLDTIIEKGTELGVTHFCLFAAAKSEKTTLSDHGLIRLKKIMVAALKQSGRLFLPKITVMPALKKWDKNSLPVSFPGFFGDVNPKAPLFIQAFHDLSLQEGFSIFIGPEAGLTSHEEERLRAWGIQGVKLHHNILRTETASICALSLAHHLLLYRNYTL